MPNRPRPWGGQAATAAGDPVDGPMPDPGERMNQRGGRNGGFGGGVAVMVGIPLVRQSTP